MQSLLRLRTLRADRGSKGFERLMRQFSWQRFHSSSHSRARRRLGLPQPSSLRATAGGTASALRSTAPRATPTATAETTAGSSTTTRARRSAAGRRRAGSASPPGAAPWRSGSASDFRAGGVTRPFAAGTWTSAPTAREAEARQRGGAVPQGGRPRGSSRPDGSPLALNGARYRGTITLRLKGRRVWVGEHPRARRVRPRRHPRELPSSWHWRR